MNEPKIDEYIQKITQFSPRKKMKIVALGEDFAQFYIVDWIGEDNEFEENMDALLIIIFELMNYLKK